MRRVEDEGVVDHAGLIIREVGETMVGIAEGAVVEADTSIHCHIMVAFL